MGMKLSTLASRAVFAVTLAIGAGLFAVEPVQAAAPMQHKQVPGFYRMMMGDFEVTALFDGGISIDSSLLSGDPALIQSLLLRSFFDDPQKVSGSVTGYLINTGSKLILIDTGTGGHWGGPSLGKLTDNLKAAGYKPAQIDLVLLTHMHADHIGGIYDAKGQRVFSKAQISMMKTESDFWLSKDIAEKAPEGAKIFFQIAQAAAAPYLAAGKWKPLQGMDEIVSGITPVAIPGHTPGHVGYRVSSKGQSLLIWGDVAHVVAVQMPHPEVGIAFDADGPTAIKTREDLFVKLAEGKTLVGGAHMPFPGFGRLRKEDTGYSWVPVTFMNLN
jgi:glyoxylase-like metal-dependent hydrolase (beta-lactamase superfamily II)